LSLGTTLWLVLVCPSVGLPTASVFRALTLPEMPVAGGALREAVRRGDIGAIGRAMAGHECSEGKVRR
jgi:hypothetical protein